MRHLLWTIVFLGDREARSTSRSIAHLTLLSAASIAAGMIVTHLWLSGDWMAQAGLSLPIAGGPLR